jgi:hypothetical protein
MRLKASTNGGIPSNELWLHEPRAVSEIQTALIWAAETKPTENSLNDIKDDNQLASLLLKVETGRTSMRAGLGRSNDEVEATFAARRATTLSKI